MSYKKLNEIKRKATILGTNDLLTNASCTGAFHLKCKSKYQAGESGPREIKTITNNQ
jgi:hypothetical protein